MAIRYCTATSKRTGKRCRARAVTGADTCYHHGGKTPRGVASPNTKHGRYSKYMPTRLLSKFEDAINDPELLELRQDLALLDTRLTELLESLDDSGKTGIRQIKANADAVTAAHRRQDDPEKISRLLNELIGSINTASRYFDSWYDIMEVQERKRRMIETEARRTRELNLNITVPEFNVFVFGLLDIIKSNIQDRVILSNINNQVLELIEGNDDIT